MTLKEMPAMLTRFHIPALTRAWWPLAGLVLATQCVAGAIWIPSGSMEPTMHAGDVLFVNRLAYNFHLPLISTAEVVRWAIPNRGDIIVFNVPAAESALEPLYIKRVTAVAGDTVEVHEHLIVLNGQPLPYSAIDGHHFTETLGGTPHRIHRAPSRFAHFGPYTVPAGHVFVMGDNRDNSSDSRVWGALPLERVRGKATFRLAGLNPSNLKSPGTL